MKKYIYIAALMTIGQLYGQDEENLGSRTIEMRPTEKRALTLKGAERNPYSRRVLEQADDNLQTNSEEVAIRTRLRDLQVTGRSYGSNGLRLLLGDILLHRGMVLPQLLTNQTQHLKVVDVSEKKITFGWMDIDTGELTGKTMKKDYDLEPSVAYILQGQFEGPGVTRNPEFGILRPGQVNQ